jgi:hypothetical protein
MALRNDASLTRRHEALAGTPGSRGHHGPSSGGDDVHPAHTDTVDPRSAHPDPVARLVPRRAT